MSLPPDVWDGLDELGRAAGVSAGELLTVVLQDAVPTDPGGRAHGGRAAAREHRRGRGAPGRAQLPPSAHAARRARRAQRGARQRRPRALAAHPRAAGLQHPGRARRSARAHHRAAHRLDARRAARRRRPVDRPSGGRTALRRICDLSGRLALLRRGSATAPATCAGTSDPSGSLTRRCTTRTAGFVALTVGLRRRDATSACT